MIENINLDKAQVSAELHGYMYSAVYGKSGVYNYGSKLGCELISNNEIKIKDGLLINSGRFMRIVGTESVAIENGTTGETRYDLIVARFETDGINETHTLKVIKGTSGAGVPEPTQQDVYNGGTIHDLPLYSVHINGLNVDEIKPLFEVVHSIEEIRKNYSNANLLANGDFQINTRGGTTYPNTNTWTLSVDKWKYIGLMTVTRNSDGTVTLAKTSNSNAAYFAQDLDETIQGNVSLSFKIKEISGKITVYMESTDGGELEVTTAGIHEIHSTNGSKNVVFRLDGSTASVTLEWVKIEHGILASKFVPKPYLEESMLCGLAISTGSDYGEVRTWADGNTSAEDRLYRFVTISGSARNIAIANSTDQIVGTSNKKENVGFIGNYTAGAESDSSKVIVSILGVSYVKTNDNTIVANDRVMSDDSGYAIKSTNNLGYRVLSVPEEGLLEIVVSPNTDMIQRIKSDMFKYNVGTAEPTTETCPDGYFYFKISG